MFQIIWSVNDILLHTSLETGIILAISILLFSHLIRNILDIWFLDDIVGRYVLITGCDSGFGYHLALKLDSLGCNVIAHFLKKVISYKNVTLFFFLIFGAVFFFFNL